jgi:hypothetical protein
MLTYLRIPETDNGENVSASVDGAEREVSILALGTDLVAEFGEYLVPPRGSDSSLRSGTVTTAGALGRPPVFLLEVQANGSARALGTPEYVVTPEAVQELARKISRLEE